MPRLTLVLLVLGAATGLALACHSGSSDSGSSDDGGSDACQPCMEADDAGVMIAIACGQNGCSHGIAVLCSKSGDPIIYDNCSIPADANACIPVCAENICGTDDQCGGTCQCAAGVPCTNSHCGNGCNGNLFAYCGPPDSGLECCALGEQCAAPVLEGGAGSCCATTGGAECIPGDASGCCNSLDQCQQIFHAADAGDAMVGLGYRCEPPDAG